MNGEAGPLRPAGLGDLIYVVTDPGVPAFGSKGASVHVQAMLREFAALARPYRRRVVLVATRLGGPPPSDLADVETIELGRPTADGPAERERALVALDETAARIVARLVAQAGPGTVVYQRYGLWSARTLQVARDVGARTILEINAPLVAEQATHRVLIDAERALDLTREAIRSAHLPYAVSSPVAAWAAEESGVPVLTIPNGVDPGRFTAEPGSGSPTPVIAFVGTFRPWHAPELLVAAAARLASDGDPVSLLLVGDGPLREDALAAAAAAGVAVTSTGAVAPAEVPALLARADIACAPYPEGDAYFSPLKVFEYLAAGLPTVSAAVADLPRLLRPEEALLTPPGDLEALTEALRTLVRDPAARARLGRAGRTAARERFAWSALARDVLTRVGAIRPVPPATLRGTS